MVRQVEWWVEPQRKLVIGKTTLIHVGSFSNIVSFKAMGCESLTRWISDHRFIDISICLSRFLCYSMVDMFAGDR